MTHKDEYLNLGDFIPEIRRRATREITPVSEIRMRNPFLALISQINNAPDTGEHRVLAGMLSTLVNEPAVKAKFRTAEISALSPVTLILLDSALDDLLNGRYDQAAMQAEIQHIKPARAMIKSCG